MKMNWKKLGRRLLMTSGVLLLLLLISVFTWANWEEPSPGMRATVVDFVQYDLAKVSNDYKISEIQSLLRKQPGVNGVTYNANSKLLVVAYAVDKTDRGDFERVIKQRSGYLLREKVFVKSGPQCPIDVAYISKVKKFFCVRD